MSLFRVKGAAAKTAVLEGRRNLLGEKDRKNLRKQFAAQYPHAGAEFFNEELFRSNVATYSFSVKGAQGVELFLSEDGVPLLFVLQKKGKLWPSLFALWKKPDLLPNVVTHPAAPPFIIKGADLMLPGCIIPSSGQIEGLLKNQMMAVRAHGNPHPYAIGLSLMDAADAQPGQKGKLLTIIHSINDLLFKMAPEVPFPEGLNLTEVLPTGEDVWTLGIPRVWSASDAAVENEEKEESESEEEELNDRKVLDVPAAEETKDAHNHQNKQQKEEGADKQEEGDEEVEEEDEEDEEVEEEDENNKDESAASLRGIYDGIVEFGLYEVLKQHIVDSMLPMDVSAIWGRIVNIVAQLDISEGLGDYLVKRKVVRKSSEVKQQMLEHVELKRTSWKNLKKFANQFKKVKVWQTKETRTQILVVKINRQIGALQNHVCTTKPLNLDEELCSSNVPAVTESKGQKSNANKVTTSPLAKGAKSVDVFVVSAPGLKTLVSNKGYMTRAEVMQSFNEIMNDLKRQSLKPPPKDPEIGADEENTDPKEEERIPDELLPDIPWYQLVPLNRNLASLILTKPERNQLKVTGGKLTSPIQPQELMNRFIRDGFRCVSLLAAKSVPTESILDPEFANLVFIIEGGPDGKKAMIEIGTQKTKRFIRTKVAGIQYFPMIEPKTLAEKLQKACAAAASVCEIEDVKGKSKPLGVVIQGNVVEEVQKFLQKEYGLPPDMIEKV